MRRKLMLRNLGYIAKHTPGKPPYAWIGICTAYQYLHLSENYVFPSVNMSAFSGKGKEEEYAAEK